MARQRRNALAGHGPIVDRARVALQHTAGQFGEIVESDDTSVTVRSTDGLTLTLEYDPGNYVFSRVYNLRITLQLPHNTAVPADLHLTHRGAGGTRFAPAKARGAHAPGTAASPRLDQLNARVGDQLRRIDLVTGAVSGPRSARTVSLVPMGGSYVWVLIPPVFKATAFPPGEPERLLDLFRSLHQWCTSDAVTS